MDVDGAAHLGRTRQRGGTHEARVQDRDGHRAIGVELVVMVGEDQRRARFQGGGHAGVDRGQPFGEVLQPTLLGYVSGELVRRSRGWTVEALGFGSDQAAQPDVAEVHQFAVLHVAEIGRVGKDGIETIG